MVKDIPDDAKPAESNVVSIQEKKSAEIKEERSKLSRHLEKIRKKPQQPIKK